MTDKLTIEEARELLRKYRSGQCTRRELEIIDAWYESFEGNKDVKIDLADPGQLDELKVQMFEGINRRIDRGEEAGGVSEGHPSPTIKLSFFTFDNLRRIAAVLLIATVAGIFFYIRPYDRVEEIGISPAVSDGMSDAKEIAKAIAPSVVYLPDGSVVWLKEGSTLEYPKAFSKDIREVSLAGEAFFDVAKDRHKPFVIHAGNLTTRVLGTTFNIKAYRNDDSQEVVVVTGKVVVSLHQAASESVRELVLTPNHKAIYSKKDNSLVELSSPESARDIGLDKRKLAFDEISLEDIIKVLNATYGVNISVSVENMNRCIVTADLSNETLETDLVILSKAINATYSIDGKDIVLLGKGCGL